MKVVEDDLKQNRIVLTAFGLKASGACLMIAPPGEGKARAVPCHMYNTCGRRTATESRREGATRSGASTAHAQERTMVAMSCRGASTMHRSPTAFASFRSRPRHNLSPHIQDPCLCGCCAVGSGKAWDIRSSRPQVAMEHPNVGDTPARSEAPIWTIRRWNLSGPAHNKTRTHAHVCACMRTCACAHTCPFACARASAFVCAPSGYTHRSDTKHVNMDPCTQAPHTQTCTGKVSTCACQRKH